MENSQIFKKLQKSHLRDDPFQCYEFFEGNVKGQTRKGSNNLAPYKVYFPIICQFSITKICLLTKNNNLIN